MGQLRMKARRPRCLETGIAICVLAVMLLAPSLVQGQCQPTAGSAKAQPATPQNPASGQPEFFDEPQFTVAGVADTTNLGGHGSNTVSRTKAELAKEIVSLSKESPGGSQPAAVAATEQSLREAVERQPENFDANYQLGRLLASNGKARDALPYLTRAAQLNFGARQDKGEVHHLLGDVEEKLGNALEAVRQYQRAAELSPSETNLFDWGAELLLHHAAEPAIEVFTRGNRLFPGSLRMLVGLGVAWYARGSYDQAAQRLCEAADLNPHDPSAYLFLGKMQQVESARADGIAERLERFARLQPENALANYYYALSLWKHRKGPDDSASLMLVESLLQKAVRLDPKLGAGHLQLGILYSERGEFSKAIPAYQKAVEVSPGLEEAHYRLAQTYKRIGEAGKAQGEFQLYNQRSREAARQAERERQEIQQFVYTLRDRTPSSQPPE